MFVRMPHQGMSFRPARDLRPRRWLSVGFSMAGLAKIGTGASLALRQGTDAITVAPLLLAAGGAMLLALVVLAHRAGVEVDGSRLRWRGIVRTETLSWAEIDRVVVDSRGASHGSKVGIDVRTKDDQVRSVPFDAVGGLEESANAEVREQLLGVILACAREAGVPVTVAGPGDPLAM